VQQFKLRLPEALRTQLEKSAEESGNSLNTEIIQRLGQSFMMDKLREGMDRTEQERADTQRRLNAMTEYLLQHVRWSSDPPQEQPKKREDAA